MSDIVRIERHDHVALIVMNRPQARNAMNVELAAATCQAINDCQDARTIVLTGEDPAFCAGLDLRSLGVSDLVALPPFNATAAASKVPMIAAVNGPAVTGGFELALACDFIIASERAAFADTHVRVGVYPGPVLVDLPRRVGMAWARQMSMTGDFVDAATALRIGLANEVVPHEALLPRAMQLASSIADQNPKMVADMRADWDQSMGLPIAQGHEVHWNNSIAGGWRDAASSDTLEANRAAVMQRSKQQRSRADMATQRASVADPSNVLDTDHESSTWAPQTDEGTSALDRLVNHRPEYAEAMRAVDGAIWSQTALDLGVLALCQLRIAQILGAGHGVDALRGEARAHVTVEHVSRLSHWPDDPIFSPTQRACLAHAEQMLIDATGIDDAAASAVVAAVGHDGFVVLSYACGFFETTTRAALVLDGRR